MSFSFNTSPLRPLIQPNPFGGEDRLTQLFADEERAAHISDVKQKVEQISAPVFQAFLEALAKGWKAWSDKEFLSEQLPLCALKAYQDGHVDLSTCAALFTYWGVLQDYRGTNALIALPLFLEDGSPCLLTWRLVQKTSRSIANRSIVPFKEDNWMTADDLKFLQEIMKDRPSIEQVLFFIADEWNEKELASSDRIGDILEWGGVIFLRRFHEVSSPLLEQALHFGEKIGESNLSKVLPKRRHSSPDLPQELARKKEAFLQIPLDPLQPKETPIQRYCEPIIFPSGKRVYVNARGVNFPEEYRSPQKKEPILYTYPSRHRLVAFPSLRIALADRLFPKSVPSLVPQIGFSSLKELMELRAIGLSPWMLPNPWIVVSKIDGYRADRQLAGPDHDDYHLFCWAMFGEKIAPVMAIATKKLYGHIPIATIAVLLDAEFAKRLSVKRGTPLTQKPLDSIRDALDYSLTPFSFDAFNKILNIARTLLQDDACLS